MAAEFEKINENTQELKDLLRFLNIAYACEMVQFTETEAQKGAKLLVKDPHLLPQLNRILKSCLKNAAQNEGLITQVLTLLINVTYFVEEGEEIANSLELEQIVEVGVWLQIP